MPLLTSEFDYLCAECNAPLPTGTTISTRGRLFDPVYCVDCVGVVSAPGVGSDPVVERPGEREKVLALMERERKRNADPQP